MCEDNIPRVARCGGDSRREAVDAKAATEHTSKKKGTMKAMQQYQWQCNNMNEKYIGEGTKALKESSQTYHEGTNASRTEEREAQMRAQ